MARKNIGKITLTAASAILIEPLLNLFAPSVKPFVKQLIDSDESKKLISSILKSFGEASSGVFVEFLANHLERLQDALRKSHAGMFVNDFGSQKMNGNNGIIIL